MALSNKRKIFVEEYLSTWNASKAARRAKYAHPGAEGHRLLKNAEIQAAIKGRMDTLHLSADEVLLRIGQIARGSDKDRLRALELLGKHHALFKERIEHSGVMGLAVSLVWPEENGDS